MEAMHDAPPVHSNAPNTSNTLLFWRLDTYFFMADVQPRIGTAVRWLGLMNCLLVRWLVSRLFSLQYVINKEPNSSHSRACFQALLL